MFRANIIIALEILYCLKVKGKMTTIIIAEELNRSNSSVENVLRTLGKHDIIHSKRGPNGGFEITFKYDILTIGELNNCFYTTHKILSPNIAKTLVSDCINYN